MSEPGRTDPRPARTARPRIAVALQDRRPPRPLACPPELQDAVELVGRRWTGAILAVLLAGGGGPLRFSEVAQAIPELSDRLLSERMKELERRGLVERRVVHAPPARVEYELTAMGRELEPALAAFGAWARRWLD